MDAFSISHTTPSRRASSRIYQDLAACRLSTYTAPVGLDQLIMNSTSKKRELQPVKPPRICIVGAGVSGLRCAGVLLDHGFDVTIFEARNRIGGRLHQTKLGTGHTIDLGANWVHGTDDNPILDLAKETYTATHKWDDNENVFADDGTLLKEPKELKDSVWDIISEAFKHSAKESPNINASESLHDFFQNKVEQKYPPNEGHERERKIIMQMSELWGAFVGSPVSLQSLKFFWLEECIDGENLFCAGTYEKILSKIAQPALEREVVKLSTKVTRIESTEDSVRIFGDNGLDEEFDEVVMTAPLGWLKNNKGAFHPPLPGRLCHAIDSIGYGTLEKVYITFPRAFWLTGGTDSSKAQFTGFTQWLAPAYSTNTNPQRWTQECVDLSTLPGASAHPTLLFYTYGDQSIGLTTELGKLSLGAERDEFLRNFFEPYYSLLPNFAEDSSDCRPVSYLATSWVTDEFAGYGSYSTFRTGLEEGDKDIEIMREGLPGRSLWFGGEHTAPFVALGTVTGAYWSGEAVGKRIAEAYGMVSKSEDDVHQREAAGETDSINNEINIRGFGDKALKI